MVTIPSDNNSEKGGISEYDIDSENQFLEPLVKVPAFIKTTRGLKSSVGVETPLINIRYLSKDVELINPKLTLNLEDLQVVDSSASLLYGLDLKVNQKYFTGRKVKEYDVSIMESPIKKDSFTKSIFRRKGYLEEEQNYFEVPSKYVSEDTEVTLLTNSRVVLFWRGFKLNEFTVKRILSLGLLYLMGEITQAELVFNIRENLPNGSFEVSVKYQTNTYVLIGIEKPIFSY